jgi:RNA polymerase sigma factor (sigma-70 family)
MRDAPDHDLMTAFRGGDREAFAVLVARHQGLVRASCQRQAPAGEIDDCIQAVFLVLARRPDSAIRAPALAAWLLRASWYVCRCAQRAARRRRQAEQQAAQARIHDSTTQPEALDHLDDCLAKLPERQRVAVSMQYLADRTPDEIASTLGVSRDNAYQLVSRGMATLRTLLARRGVALSAPALVAVFAGQSHAATAGGAADAESTLIASISATPTTGAVTLATGACSAMTIATLAPITAAAAALLLSAGAATAIACDVITTAPPSSEPTAAAAHAPLDQEITVDFNETPLAEVVAFLQHLTRMNIVVDPSVIAEDTKTVTLRAERMRTASVLELVERLTGTTHILRDEAYVITAATARVVPPGPRIDFTGADADLDGRLNQRVTFDIDGTPFTDTVGFLRQVTSANIVVDPALLTQEPPPITLKVKDMRLREALRWICEIAGTSARIEQSNVLYLSAAPAANPTEVRPASSIPAPHGPAPHDQEPAPPAANF